MNWADMMKENADRASRELVAAPTSWEPHEVWLTRIKAPRDHAAMLRDHASAGATDGHEPLC